MNNGVENNIHYTQITRPRSFVIDDCYFEKKCNNTYYAAGFIAADGCIYSNQLIIRINKRDRQLLQDILDDMKFISQGKRIIESKDDTIAIYLTSPKMCNDLCSIGITSRKSLTIGKVDIPAEFFSDFIRGYFDGDGSIFDGSGKPGKRKISFTGTKEFLIKRKYEKVTTFVSSGRTKLVLQHAVPQKCNFG